jgi:hypothetical protein
LLYQEQWYSRKRKKQIKGFILKNTKQSLSLLTRGGLDVVTGTVVVAGTVVGGGVPEHGTPLQYLHVLHFLRENNKPILSFKPDCSVKQEALSGLSTEIPSRCSEPRRTRSKKSVHINLAQCETKTHKETKSYRVLCPCVGEGDGWSKHGCARVVDSKLNVGTTRRHAFGPVSQLKRH